MRQLRTYLQSQLFALALYIGRKPFIKDLVRKYEAFLPERIRQKIHSSRLNPSDWPFF